MKKRLRTMLRDLRARHLLEPATRIAERHHVALAEVLGRRRHHPIACARHELWSYAYEIIPSYPLLGEIFDRDHSTILCGVRVHRERSSGRSRCPKGLDGIHLYRLNAQACDHCGMGFSDA